MIFLCSNFYCTTVHNQNSVFKYLNKIYNIFPLINRNFTLVLFVTLSQGKPFFQCIFSINFIINIFYRFSFHFPNIDYNGGSRNQYLPLQMFISLFEWKQQCLIFFFKFLSYIWKNFCCLLLVNLEFELSYCIICLNFIKKWLNLLFIRNKYMINNLKLCVEK